MNEYTIHNEEGKITRTVQAESIEDAKANTEALIAQDGSYWHCERWRTIRDNSGKIIYLKKQ